MSRFYNPHRSRNLYVPGAEKPFKLSRSKIDLFVKCPRGFYIARRLGTGQLPEMFDKTLYEQKCDLVYQHVYESYYGAGESV